SLPSGQTASRARRGFDKWPERVRATRVFRQACSYFPWCQSLRKGPGQHFERPARSGRASARTTVKTRRGPSARSRRRSEAIIKLIVLAITIGMASPLTRALGQQPSPAAAQPIPHGQDAAPNAPRSPDEAVKAMSVPPGFTVEVVASEPDIVN